MNAWDLAIGDVVKDPTWQTLRGKMVGTWSSRPRRNVRWLREYLFPLPEEHLERTLRLRRVLNYLTGSGFRLGVIEDPAIDRLLSDVRQLCNRERARRA